MSLELVKEYFKEKNIEDRIIELHESSATVALAAAALHVEEARIAKTMSFVVGENVILVVMAGDAKIQNHLYKKEFGKKVKMVAYDSTELLVGHAPGGVCPFAVKENVKVYLDESLKRFETVFPACGSYNSAIELTIPELEMYSQNFVKWVNVCYIV